MMNLGKVRVLATTALAAALLSQGGCVRRLRPSTGRLVPGARQERELRQQAARELRCDGRALVLTPLSSRVYQVLGCGQMRDYAYGVGGTRGWTPLQPVYERAVVEMACPLEQLRITAPTATMRSAFGCGRTARYDLVCDARECSWRMTSHAGAWAAGAGAVVGVGPPAVAEPGPSPTPSTDEIAIPEAPAPGSAEAVLRAALDALRDTIHRCAGTGAIPVRARWTDEGVVTLALEPPMAGGPAEQCVRDAFVGLRVPGGSAGEIVHPVF